MDVPNRLNQRWSMDFVSDQQSSGRRFRTLNIVDDYSRKASRATCICINQWTASRFLTQLIEVRDKPNHIVGDNDTECTSKAICFGLRQPR